MNEIKLHYSEALVREAVRTFVWRSVVRGLGVRVLVACVVLVVCVAYRWAQGDRGWLVGVLAATPVFMGLALVALYVAHYRNTVGRFRAMRVPEATLTYTEDQFTLTSVLGSVTLPWSAISEVWKYPRFWLILFSRSGFSTLPLADLDAEAQALIARKTTPISPP